MNWLGTQMALVDVAMNMVEFALNWLLQSSFLLAIGLMIGRLLRKRGSAVQSAIYRTTMVAVLICPLATWGLSQAGVSGWSVELPRDWGQQRSDGGVAAVDQQVPVTPAELADPMVTPTIPTEKFPLETNDEFSESLTSEDPSPIKLDVEQTREAPSVVASSLAEESDEPVPVSSSTSILGFIALGMVASWLLISFALSTRLATAWRQLAGLRRRAVHADEGTIQACHELASALNVSAPEVLRSPCLPSPCLTGLRRPAVLLPEADHSLSIRDVLVHELAHLRRYDCHWNLLRQTATAVFFFQPLLWKLSRLLETTAEEVCDDYVVQLGGDRHEYAHRLVDIAELSSAPIAAAGVGIVSLRSMLAMRVTRIMDTSRTLSTRVGNLLLAVVLMSGLLGTTITGLVGLAPRHLQAEAEAIVDGDDSATVEGSNDKENAEITEEDDVITVRGKVVDPDGQPVAEANVFVAWVFVGDGRLLPPSSPSQQVEHKIVARTTSDAFGEYELSFSTESPERGRISYGWHLAAVAPGRGPAWARDVHVWKHRSPRLHLTRDETVRGRIVDLEGAPVAGVRVSVRELRPAKSDQAIVDWIADSKEKSPPSQLEDYHESSVTDSSARYPRRFPTTWNDGGLAQGSPALPPDVQTDESGHFEFRGLGANRLAILEVEGPSIAKCYLQVVTRNMSPLDAKPLDFVGIRSGTYYGCEFQFVAEPSQSIVGSITDIETDEPIAGVEVRLGQFAGNIWSQQDFLTTRTDAKGKYRLLGAPQGGGHRIVVVPSIDQPYFSTGKTLDKVPGNLNDIPCDFNLRRGKWIVGKVTDDRTNQPIADATVHYLPLRRNKYAPHYPNYRPEVTGMVPGDRYRTTEDGTFRVLAIPGAGILAAIARGENQSAYATLTPEDVPEHLVGEAPSTNTYHPWTVVQYHTLREVKLTESEDQVEYDLSLTRGLTRRLNLVGTDGGQVTGVRVLGRKYPSSYLEKPLEESSIELIGLRENDQRIVVLLHPEKRTGKSLTVSPGDELTVALEPCSIVRGRVVDEDGEPISDVEVKVSIDGSDNWHRGLLNSTTDVDGRFEVVLPSGMICRIWHYSRNGHDFSADVEPKPGAVFDLGDLTTGTRLSVDQTAKLLVDKDAAKLSIPKPPEPSTVDITNDDRPKPVRTKAVAATNTNASSDSGNKNTVPVAQDSISQEYEGKVVDPLGQPVEGAELYLVFHIPQPTGLLTPIWKPLASTDASGEFQFTASPADFGIRSTAREFGYGMLVAVKDGYGFAWSPAGMYEKSGTWLLMARARLKETPAEFLQQMKHMLRGAGAPLKLVADDQPIRGRIMDINGQPVAGAKLTLLRIWSGAGDDLTEWREATKEAKADFYLARMKTPKSMNGPQVRSLVEPAVTDREGRFTLSGVGRGRIAQLLVEGSGIESAKIYARTETGEKIELLRERRSPDLGSYVYHPAELMHIAGPSTTVTGIVRDAETQKPLSGVTVKSQSRHGERISGWGQDFVRALTDEQGRYRLEGMPIGKDNRIAAIAPMGNLAYFSMSKRAPTTSQNGPLEIDFELRRGVWVEGRITDKQTGKGLSGRLAYYVKKGSPSYKFARSLGVDERDRLQSNDDGNFRIAALPGPGYVTFMAHEHQNYPRANVILKSDGSREKVGRTMLETGPSILMPQNYHLVAEIDPADDAERVELNLQLNGGNSLIGSVVDPDGTPVTGYYYTGQMAQFDTWKLASSDKFELKGYDPDSPRHVYITHSKQNLAGHLVVKEEPSKDVVIKLQPAGKVTGRLVDEDGAPLANCELMPWHPPMSSPADADRTYHAPPLPRNTANSTTGQYETDDEGRFDLSCLVPGVEYRVRAFDRASMTPGRGRRPKFSGPLEVVIQVEPGESKDLGDVRLTDDAKFIAADRHAKVESPTVQKEHQTMVTGKVTLTDGKPASDAHVAVIAMRIQPARGGDLSSNGEVLAEGRTDDSGNYRLNIEGANSKTHRYASVIAKKDGSAVAWDRLNLDDADAEASLELLAEEPIIGKLVDIEGQPAGKVQLQIQSVMERSDDGRPSRDAVGFRGDQVLEAWLPPVTSDNDGRFTIRGVPPGYGVFLNVVGGERFAPQDVALNTGIPEQRGERDGTYRSLVKNMKQGEELVLPLAPAQLFEGVVTYEDTGEPAPHARLTIWASQQEPYGSMVSVSGTADAQGRYRISPRPGIRFGVTAYAPDGAPYLPRETPIGEAIRWHAGDRVRQVDMTLPRGVLVRGKVVEADTDVPIAGASLQYLPESANNPNTSDDILTGWQAIQVSNEKGEFEIAVLPGPGRLLLHGPRNEYVIEETTTNQISRGRPGGNRQYAHHIQRIDVTADQSPVEISFELHRGGTVHGTLVDEAGQSVDRARMVSWRNLRAADLGWRGHSPEVIGGQFEMGGLVEGEEYPVHFLHAERTLGATAMISADEPSPRVVLKPCAAATMRLVDKQGQPVANLSAVNVYLVVRSGVDQYDSKAMREGAVAADADFISNVDRINYPGLKSTDTDTEGRIRLPVLIPGATYRIVTLNKGRFTVIKSFVVESSEIVDLGDMTVDVQGE